MQNTGKYDPIQKKKETIDIQTQNVKVDVTSRQEC